MIAAELNGEPVDPFGTKQAKDEMIADAAARKPLDRDEFERVSARLGRDYGPRLLARLDETGLADSDFLVYALPAVWQMHEHPEHSDELPWWKWQALFGRAGFIRNSERAERPTGRVRLYRGAAEPFRRGMSWTPSRELAQWFADRFADRFHGALWMANVPWTKVLAVIDDQRDGETEYVIDPYRLRISRAAQ